MWSGDKTPTVFVSSTSEDLEDYRAVARNVILDLGWHPQMMEHLGARPSPPVQECQQQVEQSDLVLLLLAFRRGWVPSIEQGGNGTDSITALELAHARSKRVPVLALMATPSWPGNLWEANQDGRDWVELFRQGLNLPAVFFDREPMTTAESDRLPAFRAKVRQALLDHKERILSARTAKIDETSHVDYFNPARQGLLEGTDIPFVGMGVYGKGPLSSDVLTTAFEGSARLHERSLATVAEYVERLNGSREAFLRTFRRILTEQTARVEPVPVYDLIASAPNLRLVICATFDRTLDQRLAEAARPHVVLMHVLRSFEGRHDGKILVLRPDAAPELCLADKLIVSETECVIYRPLGSPFLPTGLDPEDEIDTVVVTESDHLTFLRRLENQHTQIPAKLIRLFKRCPLLFLGYGLDVWQYRLVMQVFQSVGTRGPQPVTRAVRVPDTDMEEVAWKRLNADLIRMDPNDFARRALGGEGAAGGTAGYVSS